MNNNEILSEDDIDYLSEMANIAAGNAANALNQMLPCSVELKIPEIHVLPIPQAPAILGDPTLPVACVEMRMLGDVEGHLFFILPETYEETMIHLVEQHAVPELKESRPGTDFSVLEETGNVLAGAYLLAIHDFSGLNVYHTTPTVAVDAIQSLLDESLSGLSREVREALIVRNEFIIEQEAFTTHLLVVPSDKSIHSLVDSMKDAKEMLGIGPY